MIHDDTKNASLSPTLPVLLVLHAVFLTMRSALVRLLGPLPVADAESALSQGQVQLAYTLLEGGAVAPDSAEGDRAAAGTMLAALAMAHTATLAGPRRRQFYARVSLLGHRSLGVCHVQETELAGADVLMCRQLCEESEQVHWIRAQGVYDLQEIPRDTAEREAAEYAQARAKVRAREAEQAAAAAVERAKVLDARARSTCTVRLWGPHVIMEASLLDALTERHADLREGVEALGIETWRIDPYWAPNGGPLVGVRIERAGGKLAELAELAEKLGFERVVGVDAVAESVPRADVVDAEFEVNGDEEETEALS